jgi:class 3 adenylate cyclase
MAFKRAIDEARIAVSEFAAVALTAAAPSPSLRSLAATAYGRCVLGNGGYSGCRLDVHGCTVQLRNLMGSNCISWVLGGRTHADASVLEDL